MFEQNLPEFGRPVLRRANNGEGKEQRQMGLLEGSLQDRCWPRKSASNGAETKENLFKETSADAVVFKSFEVFYSVYFGTFEL